MPIAALVTCFAEMNKQRIDYIELIKPLELKLKTKSGSGFASSKKRTNIKLS